jgi:hypothetical protein
LGEGGLSGGLAGADRGPFILERPGAVDSLLRKFDDSRLFASLGPKPSIETIAAMRAQPGSTEAIGNLIALCEEAELDTYLVETTAGEVPQVT